MNDLDAYEILIREHEQMLQSYLLVMVHDPSLAEDLAQQAFVQAYQKLSTLKKKESFAAWLRTIARNLAINELRHRKHEVPTDPAVIEGMEDIFLRLDAPGTADTWAERVRAVELCFEKLSEVLQQFQVRDISLGDWGYSAVPPGVSYAIDNFELVPVIGTRERGVTLRWSAADAGGIHGYSYSWSPDPSEEDWVLVLARAE